MTRRGRNRREASARAAGRPAPANIITNDPPAPWSAEPATRPVPAITDDIIPIRAFVRQRTEHVMRIDQRLDDDGGKIGWACSCGERGPMKSQRFDHARAHGHQHVAAMSQFKSTWSLVADLSDLRAHGVERPLVRFTIHGDDVDVNFHLSHDDRNGDGEIAGWHYRPDGNAAIDGVFVRVLIIND